VLLARQKADVILASHTDNIGVMDSGTRSLRSLGRNDSYAGSRYGSNASIEIFSVGSASGPQIS
jgi:hypothetical protein